MPHTDAVRLGDKVSEDARTGSVGVLTQGKLFYASLNSEEKRTANYGDDLVHGRP